jgi:hypothetical protein
VTVADDCAELTPAGLRAAGSVTRPGVYDADTMPEVLYHSDPVPGGSLSCSGAKLVLKAPAIFDWARKQPRLPTRAMEFGTAAHKEMLGVGWPVEVWPGTDWTRLVDGVNPGKWAAQQRLAGKVPVLASDREKITAMRAAIEAHPAARLLIMGEVMPEWSYFWQDEEWGIWRRARMDAVRLAGRVLIMDYKTAYSASPDEFAKAAGRLLYHMQDPWYKDAVTHTLGDADPAFLFVAQEKDPPYLVGIYELEPESVLAGRARNARACREYARCVAAGEWPGYQPGETVTRISVPRWAQ